LQLLTGTREFNVPDNDSSCKEKQGTSEITPLLSKVGLASMDPGSHSSINSTATHPFADEVAELPTHETIASSTRPLGKTDSGSKVERGRTGQRTARPSNTLEKAESRHRMRDATVEVDVQSIKSRYRRCVAFFEDPTDPCAALEDNLLKPFSHDPICNKVFEMARPIRNSQTGVDTPSPVAGFVRTNSNKFHDISRESTCSTKSFLANGQILYSSPTLTAEAILELLASLNHAECASIKSLTEVWSSTTSCERRVSVMTSLSAEVLCQIYNRLSPADFNSARHACRLWYINSLDRSLLETMLRRGGWSTSIDNGIAFNHVLDSKARVNDEWLMSKRIARECALGPDWTGNGLCPANESLKCLYIKHGMKKTPFIHTSTTDFTEVAVHYPVSDEPTSGINFTVSTCGKFLMVAHGCLVYIYELNCSYNYNEIIDGRQNGALKPVTSVICPRKVLACSMDTSSHRYAIAVLLDGRMGLVYDLTSLKDHIKRRSTSRNRMSRDTSLPRGSEYRNRASISSSRLRGLHRAQTDQPFVFPVIPLEASQSSFSLEPERTTWEDETQSQVLNYGTPVPDQSQTSARSLFGQIEFQGHAPNLCPPCTMPVETSIPTIYAPLCSADDMPRSVALCPQRRWVAFGCSSGIELHWVNALTGQGLNRWFPLTAPSDYLYFLPLRPGVDSVKKLRLISSAGQPGENSVIAERYGGIRSGTYASPFWGVQSGQQSNGPADVASANRAGLSAPSRDNSDHYRAVPLSDGYHILFTDPSTGFLCLGSDAPIGGPTKLLRKIWFVGPQGQGSPVSYTGGSDLRWGARVVAAYRHGTEQSIWLFSVPPDVFTESQAEQGGINFPFAGISSGIENGSRDWVKWWCNIDSTNSPEPVYGASHAMTIRHGRPWPLQVRGQEIGRCHGVVDLAIDAGPEMTIWAFGKEGLAKTWQIDDGSLDASTNRRVLVMRDGTIRETDASGDIQMVENPSPFEESLHTMGTQNQETFNGSTSMLNSGIFLGQKIWNCQGAGSQNIVSLDADGDVLMADLPSPESPVYENWSTELFESVALA
jgi:hypothetical protein